jgi:hypothetical protein
MKAAEQTEKKTQTKVSSGVDHPQDTAAAPGASVYEPLKR